jgi:hypothetical protein
VSVNGLSLAVSSILFFIVNFMLSTLDRIQRHSSARGSDLDASPLRLISLGSGTHLYSS